MHKLHPLIAACTVAVLAVAAQAQTTSDDPDLTHTPSSGSTTPSTGMGTSPSDTGSSSTPGTGMGTSSSERSTSSALSVEERNFIVEAAQSGNAELQASQLALSRATDPKVKEFAQQMVDDHKRANAQLQQLAQTKGVSLPSDTLSKQKYQLKSLEARKGAKFDHEYVEDFGVKAHRQTLERFRKEAQDGRDPDLRTFAQQLLPTLETHLQHAMDMQNKLKRGGMTERSSDTSTRRSPQS